MPGYLAPGILVPEDRYAQLPGIATLSPGYADRFAQLGYADRATNREARGR